MSRNAVYVRVLLVVMVVAVLLSFLGRNSNPAPRDAWVPSSFNAVGAGSLAFYDTLRDLHWPVDRWRDPLSRLAAQGDGNTLLIARSGVDWRVAFTQDESDLLAGWVATGNTLVLLGPLAKWDDTRDLLAVFGIQAPRSTSPQFFDGFHLGPEGQIDAQPSASVTGRLILPEGPALPAHLPAGVQVLWRNGAEPEVVTLPHGRGRVVCIASDQVLGNRYLSQGDNLDIVLRLLAPDGQVPRHLFFEERHHGYAPSFAVAQLFGHPGVRLAGLLALLGALTFFGSTFVRFGPILPLERQPGRSSLEFVDSIAELYHRSDLGNETMRFLFDETHRHLLTRLGLPDTAPHEIIASRLQRAHPGLPGWKKLAHRFDSPDYVEGLPPSGWLRIARELIQIKNAVA
jgi:hypothetical protein